MPDYTWTPDALIHYPLVSNVAVSPHGTQIAYTVRVPHLTEDASEFRRQLWVVDRAVDAPPRLLAHGYTAEQPRWSPDGTRIAFLRRTGEDKLGLWIISANGGEPWRLTAVTPVHGDIAFFRWSPDGTHIAFLAPPIDDAKAKRIAQRDDALHYRVDFDFAHIFVTQVTDPTEPPPVPVQRTSGQHHVTALSWSGDGQTLAFTFQDSPLHDSWTTLRLAVMPAAGDYSASRNLGPVSNQDSAPAWSPDGRWIACEAGTEPNGWPYAGTIRLFSLAEGDTLDLARVSDEEPTLIGWNADGSGVYVLNQRGTESEICFLPADGGPAAVVCAPGKLVTATDLNAHNHLAAVMEDFHEPHTVYTASLAGKSLVEVSQVTRPVSNFPRKLQIAVQHLRWQTPDGFDIEGLLYHPADHDPGRDGPLPLLLHIHGGPTAVFQRQYAATPYYYTPAAFCERGIAVLRCNPRGSGGYGKHFRFANVRDWGGGDYGDLQQGVDTVIEMGVADPARLGIAGWSYGGFMTSWTITQTDRFKAASIGAAVTNAATFCGTADIPGFIPDYFGGEAWEIPEFYREHSPITHVANARTPSIIQHGAADERVPIEQGLQYYNSLKRRGIPVDMYIYPRQGHAITEPRLLADAIRRNLEWFTATLTDGAEEPA